MSIEGQNLVVPGTEPRSWPPTGVPHYTAQQVSEVLRDYASNSSTLKATCNAHGLELSGVWWWVCHQHCAREDESSLYGFYLAAREKKAHLLAEESVEISDSEDREASHQRNRIQARQWIASKLNPASYGDRIQHDVRAAVVQVFVPTRTPPTEGA